MWCVGHRRAGSRAMVADWRGELGAAFLDSDTAAESVVKAGLAAAGMSVDDRDSPEYKRHFRGVGRQALQAWT